ncbi:MAG: hypothetical protein JEY99_07930 [Spirochaetales bacterium]|nr:hypothetical protein [Spirochaetales bacterium]
MIGTYPSRAFGTVHRYRCKACGMTFSSQTFSIDYYAKKRVSYVRLLQHLNSASGLGDISRFFNLRVETLENRLERVARVGLAIEAALEKHLPCTENMTADGFETFSYSQYYPCHVNTFVGSDSEYVYTMGFSNLRRKGRMTAKQKARRAELENQGKASPTAIQKSFRICTDKILQLVKSKEVSASSEKNILYTDEHKAYPLAFRKLDGFEEAFDHVQISSKKPRTVYNNLFPSNYFHRFLRMDLSDHTRETLQWAKCPSALMARMEAFRFAYNCFNPRRVKASRAGDWTTHAEAAGITRAVLSDTINEFWGKRPFLGKTNLSEDEVKTWTCQWTNPGRTVGRRIPNYIFL